MGEPSIIQANERVKAIANLLFNLGGALLGAAVVCVYAEVTVDPASAVWFLASAALIWLAYMLLGLLQSETVA